MRTVIIISRCLDVRPGRNNFHFRGFYAGEEIKSLQLVAIGGLTWVKHAEYVMHVKVVKVEAGVLYGEVLRGKLLSELTD